MPRIIVELTVQEYVDAIAKKGTDTWRHVLLTRGLGIDTEPRKPGRITGDALDRLHDKFRVNQEKRRARK